MAYAAAAEYGSSLPSTFTQNAGDSTIRVVDSSYVVFVVRDTLTSVPSQVRIDVYDVDTTAADDVAKHRFGAVIEMMRDPARSTFAFVMYPESTPILEAYRASEELRTVGITTGLVVANLVIPAEQATTPFTQSRRVMQEKYLNEIAQRFAVPVVQVPLLAHEVKGIPMLIELGQQVYGDGQIVQATPGVMPQLEPVGLNN